MKTFDSNILCCASAQMDENIYFVVFCDIYIWNKILDLEL